MKNEHILKSPSELSLSFLAYIEKENETLLNIDHLSEKLFIIFNEQSDRDRAVIWQILGFAGAPLATLEQVGKYLCVTRERVRQVEKNAIRRIIIRLEQYRYSFQNNPSTPSASSGLRGGE